MVVNQQQPQPTTVIATQDVQVINNLDRGSDISPDLSPAKKKSKNYDEECIIMGDELSHLTITYALELLKMQFVDLNGFNSTPLQDKAAQWLQDQVKDKVKIILLIGITGPL